MPATLVYGLIVGIAMGAIIQRIGASSPRMILASLRLENITIIKFMATTIAVASVLAYIMSFFIPMHFDIKPTYVIGVTIGGLVFGAGFAIGGYCPGTCVVGFGEGRRDALFAILGGILGALVFTLVFNAIAAPLMQPLNLGKITLYDLLHVKPLIGAVILAAVFLAAVKVIPTQPRHSENQAKA